jgi:hypothetical protein
MTQTNTKTLLTAKQQRLLVGLAEGLTQREAAIEAGIHPISACIITKRPDFREAMLQVRAEANARLAARLPALVDQALDVLELELRTPSERRLRAAKITLDLAARLCNAPEAAPLQTAGLQSIGGLE